MAENGVCNGACCLSENGDCDCPVDGYQIHDETCPPEHLIRQRREQAALKLLPRLLEHFDSHLCEGCELCDPYVLRLRDDVRAVLGEEVE